MLINTRDRELMELLYFDNLMSIAEFESYDSLFVVAVTFAGECFASRSHSVSGNREITNRSGLFREIVSFAGGSSRCDDEDERIASSEVTS